LDGFYISIQLIVSLSEHIRRYLLSFSELEILHNIMRLSLSWHTRADFLYSGSKKHVFINLNSI